MTKLIWNVSTNFFYSIFFSCTLFFYFYLIYNSSYYLNTKNNEHFPITGGAMYFAVVGLLSFCHNKFESRHEKINILHMRKQRRRSASQ